MRLPLRARRRLLSGGLLLFAAAVASAVPGTGAPAASLDRKPDLKVAGAALFEQKGCAHCHGTDARGGELGPDLGTVGKRLKPPQIEHQIHDGGGGMPAFADALQPDEITALVDFLHAKRKVPKARQHPVAPTPAAPAPAP